MNKITLRFDDRQMEDLYFYDQFEELFSFYTWACWLGSISAFSVFFLEFFIPFGFQQWIYTLVLIPVGFLISHKFIKAQPQFFNTILALINISLAGLIFMLLYYFAKSNFLFLAGQTVAMIQYSLMLGSNIMMNIIVLLLNQLGLMLMTTIIDDYFNSLQIMFILALILVLKSIWSNEKMKRQFFLLKQQNQQLHQQLDTQFQLIIIKCKFDKKKIKFNLLSINKQGEKVIKDQIGFTKFLRDFDQISMNSSTINEQKHSLRKTTLEQYLFKFMEGQEHDSNTKIYSETMEIAYKISICQVIEQGEVDFILLLQEDSDYTKLVKLKQLLKKKSSIQRQLFSCFGDIKESLGLVSYLIQYILIQQKQQLKLKQNIAKVVQTGQSYLQILNMIQMKLFKPIHCFYNCLIYNNEFNQFKQITQFSGHKLLQCLNKMKFILKTKKNLQITLESDNIHFEQQFALVLELILNIISDTLELQQTFEEKVGVIVSKIFLNHNKMLNQKIIDYNTMQSKFINERILEYIGWSKYISMNQYPYYDYIEFSIIQSLVNFQEQILY